MKQRESSNERCRGRWYRRSTIETELRAMADQESIIICN